jgi:hypothetical protein
MRRDTPTPQVTGGMVRVGGEFAPFRRSVTVTEVRDGS